MKFTASAKKCVLMEEQKNFPLFASFAKIPERYISNVFLFDI
ncbi:hypothetical protein CU016_0975 [Enterococcus lactis]|nr:hypothetical protein [Enterococcus lactis]MBL5014214.1 hypothetical protein [Enterococcus lactis]